MRSYSPSQLMCPHSLSSRFPHRYHRPFIPMDPKAAPWPCKKNQLRAGAGGFPHEVALSTAIYLGPRTFLYSPEHLETSCPLPQIQTCSNHFSACISGSQFESSTVTCSRPLLTILFIGGNKMKISSGSVGARIRNSLTCPRISPTGLPTTSVITTHTWDLVSAPSVESSSFGNYAK